jgi:hypothetical protein
MRYRPVSSVRRRLSLSRTTSCLSLSLSVRVSVCLSLCDRLVIETPYSNDEIQFFFCFEFHADALAFLSLETFCEGDWISAVAVRIRSSLFVCLSCARPSIAAHINQLPVIGVTDDLTEKTTVIQLVCRKSLYFFIDFCIKNATRLPVCIYCYFILTTKRN